MCQLDLDAGSETCDVKGKHRRFYFDAETWECKRFIWTGCEGNSNRFRTKVLCEKMCKGEQKDLYDWDYLFE